MDDLEARVAALCAAPAGCAFLLHVETAGLSAEEVTRPEVAVHLVSAGQNEVRPFSGDHDELVARALAHGARLTGLARSMLARPEAEGWFTPVDRDAQLWLGNAGEKPDPSRMATPVGDSVWWERYAQKPTGGFWTSSQIGGASSVLAALKTGCTDLGADLTLPVAAFRLRAAPAARVFEVDGPGAWRRLPALPGPR